MGYQLIPGPLKSDSEEDPARPLVVLFGKDGHIKEASKSNLSFEPLTSEEVTKLRENVGWNEFVTKEPHVACKLIEAVGATQSSLRLTYTNDLIYF